jgi:hypothetical protein
MLSDRLSRILTAYVDGELNDRQQKMVQHLLQQSRQARKFLERLQADAGLLRDMPRRAVGQDLSAPILQQIAGKNARPVRPVLTLRKSGIPAWLGLATAAAVLVITGLGSYLYFVAAAPKSAPLTQDSSETNKKLVASAVHPDTDDPLPDPATFLPSNTAVASTNQPREKKRDEPPPRKSEVASKPNSLGSMPAPLKEEANKEIYTKELIPEKEAFQKSDVNIALILKLREIEIARRKKELAEELHRGSSHYLDLVCQDTASAMERLQAAFEARGIRLLIDQDAQDRLKLRFRTNYALYTENVSPDEVLSILQQLSGEDRKAESKRRGTTQFGTLIVNKMNEEDYKIFAKVIGTESRLDKPPQPKTHRDVDYRKPLSIGTAEQVVQSLKGQGGTPRPQPGKPFIKPTDRMALVVAYNPIRPRPASPEVKFFLDNRKETRSGTMHMLLILRVSG